MKLLQHLEDKHKSPIQNRGELNYVYNFYI